LHLAKVPSDILFRNGVTQFFAVIIIIIIIIIPRKIIAIGWESDNPSSSSSN